MGFLGHCAALAPDTAVPSATAHGGLRCLHPPCAAAHPHGGAASTEPLVCPALLKPVLQDALSHDTESSGDSVAQARSQRVLCFDLLFPPNARNHKDFNSLRNCHEMKILRKNNSCNMVRTRFYFCSYVFRAMLGCGCARGENSQFPTVPVCRSTSEM